MRQLVVPLLLLMAVLAGVFLLAFAFLTPEHEAKMCRSTIYAASKCVSVEEFPCSWLKNDDPRLDDLEYVCEGDGSGGIPQEVIPGEAVD